MSGAEQLHASGAREDRPITSQRMPYSRLVRYILGDIGTTLLLLLLLFNSSLARSTHSGNSWGRNKFQNPKDCALDLRASMMGGTAWGCHRSDPEYWAMCSS